MKSTFFTWLAANRWAVIFSSLAFFWWTYIAFTNDAVIGGSDGYMHFRIAHYAFQYPNLFFNHWGKPFFTLLMAIPTQGGFAWAECFTAFLSALGLLFSADLLRRVQVPKSWLVVLIIFPVPVYYDLSLAVMTEIPFATCSVLVLWLFSHKRYWATAILAGFFIWIRNEGFLLLIPVILGLLSKNQWKTLPALLIGFLVFTLGGLWHHHDFWWFFTKMPYGDATDIYGTGSIWHFVLEAERIWGYALSVAFVLGLMGGVAVTIKTRHFLFSTQGMLWWMSAMGAIIFIAAHSYSWYSGRGSSLGLVRIMASVVPLMAIATFSGIAASATKFYHQKLAKLILLLLTAFSISWWYFAQPKFPDENDIMEVNRKAALHFKKQHYKGEKVHYMSPAFIHHLGVDPYNTDVTRQYYNMPSPTEIDAGEIVIWDALHGPNEGKLELDSLLTKKGYKLIAYYNPEKPFTVLHDRDFAIYAFKKMPGDTMYHNDSLKHFLAQQLEEQKKTVELYNRSEPDTLHEGDAFSVSMEKQGHEINLAHKYDLLVSGEIDTTNLQRDELQHTFVVMTQNQGLKSLHYQAFPLHELLNGNTFSARFKPSSNKPSSTIKCYVYISKSQKVILQSMKVIARERLLN